jgi:hypothetical protein
MSNEELYQRLVSQPTLGATYQTNYPDAYEQFKNYLKVRAQIQ